MSCESAVIIAEFFNICVTKYLKNLFCLGIKSISLPQAVDIKGIFNLFAALEAK
jgi:hypothetical protein